MAEPKRIAAFILAKEAGKNKDPHDGNAKNPAPGTGGVHTNKGVSWGTFKALAGVVGYPATVAQFLAMPLELWTRIFTRGFWDQMGGANIDSAAVADLMADYAYMTRPEKSVELVRLLLRNLGHSYLPAKGGPDRGFYAAVNSTEEATLVRAFIAARMVQINRNERYAKGWTKRLNELRKLIGYPVPAVVIPSKI